MSPDQEKAVALWTEGARDALDSAEKLCGLKKYAHALFFCHLAVEKALKAAYIAAHDALPPYTHDLRRLADLTERDLSHRERESFKEINTFNVAGRYAEEKRSLAKKATLEYARIWLDRTREILQDLLP